jgi:AcrR family transcriptional regulator
MTKGEDTKTSILQQALDLASEVGLEGLTFGALAKQAGMSKSGLYAHFESKEDLQCQVLDAAAELFGAVVLSRALRQPRGLPRVRELFALWVDWTAGELRGGCPFVAAATEFDDRAGRVRDRLVEHLRHATEAIARMARTGVEAGHFRGDLDVEQFAFEFWALLLAYHHFSRLLGREDARTRADHAFTALLQNATAV